MVVKIIGGPSVKSVWFEGSLKANNGPNGCQEVATVVVKIIRGPSVKIVWLGGSLKANNGPSGCHGGLMMAIVTGITLQ